MKYFNKLDCRKVSIPYDISIMRSMIKTHLEKSLCIDGGAVKNELLCIL
jgi:hypothetical protein